MDLVELETAKSLYRSHRRRLKTLFSREEISYIQKDKKPHERLAILLAAKEAVFKALSPAWMGVSGFQDIQIFPQSNHRLVVRLKGSFGRLAASSLLRHSARGRGRPRSCLKKNQENLEISLLKKHRNYVVVGCRGMV